MSTDVTQTQHSSTVTDDAHQVTATGIAGGFVRILSNLHAGHSHAGRIGKSEVIDSKARLVGQHLQLAGARCLVVIQSSLG